MAKSHCGRKRTLERDHNLSNTVKHLFLDYQWSPEEIEGRLRLEYEKTVISYLIIYRAIYRGHFDDNSLSHRARGGIRKHRHRGKTSHQTIQLQENKLNNWPRNEIFYGESMHLI